MTSAPYNRVGLDIGCGRDFCRPRMDGVRFYGIDINPEVHPDYVGDVRTLPFEDESFDVIHSSHVLEHIARAEFDSTLSEWLRLVKRGGEAWFRLPNLMWAARKLLEENVIDGNVLNVLYGGQENQYDFHTNGFTPGRLQVEVESRGFITIHYSEYSYNLCMGFIKT